MRIRASFAFPHNFLFARELAGALGPRDGWPIAALLCMTPIGKILVAHDFSETANRTLDLAIDLASHLGASVTVVHAYEVGLPAMPMGIDRMPELNERIASAGREALDAIVARAKSGGFSAIEGVLLQGIPWMEIDRLAEELKTDLIVMGTHGRHGLAHALLGSVAEKVVRTAPCPVLTVRGLAHGG